MAEDRNIEIEPLSDQELEGVAGGTEPATSTGDSCCSCSNCSNSKPPAS